MPYIKPRNSDCNVHQSCALSAFIPMVIGAINIDKYIAVLPLQAAPQLHQPPHPLSGCHRFLRVPLHVLFNYAHRRLLVPR